MNSNRIYVFGHKNPDCDSVCAAISLSYLKNKLGYNTIPAVLGNINDETRFALDHFGFKTPYHLNDVKLQLKDVDYHRNNFVNMNSTIKDAFDYMNKYTLTGIPVVEGKNKYFGYISLKEIAYEVINGDFHKLDTSYGNIMDVLKGEKILKFDKEISGNVLAATYAHETFLNKIKLDNSYILIIGDRKAILEYAIDCKVKLIVLVAGSEITSELLEKACKNKVNIIRTSLGSYDVGKLISLSNYIKNFVRLESDSITFNEVDYLSDFIEKSKQFKHTNYPIINSRKECSGVLTLTDTNHVKRKQVMLVDHNNFIQSVDGLDEAEIVEVVDHHNIGDIVTKRPINFRNSNCGCCSTMIYEMYGENNIEIPSNIAGLLCSAIISDTLLLTSPTATERDKKALEELSLIANIDYKEYGMKMLKKGMNVSNLTVDQMLHKDFKSFKTDDYLIGIGQLLISDFRSIKNRSEEIVNYLNELSIKEGYKVLTLFVTDVFDRESYCFYNEEADDVIMNSFNINKVYEGVKLSGILSRKAQIAPYIMETLSR